MVLVSGGCEDNARNEQFFKEIIGCDNQVIYEESEVIYEEGGKDNADTFLTSIIQNFCDGNNMMIKSEPVDESDSLEYNEDGESNGGNFQNHEYGDEIDESPIILDEDSHITNETPHISNETPHISNETHHISDKTPHIMDESPHIMDENQHIFNETPYITNENPHLTNENNHLTNENSNIIIENPHTIIQNPHIVNEIPYSVDENLDANNGSTHSIDESENVVDEEAFIGTADDGKMLLNAKEETDEIESLEEEYSEMGDDQQFIAQINAEINKLLLDKQLTEGHGNDYPAGEEMSDVDMEDVDAVVNNTSDCEDYTPGR